MTKEQIRMSVAVKKEWKNEYAVMARRRMHLMAVMTLFTVMMAVDCMRDKPIDPLDVAPQIRIDPAFDETDTLTADSLFITLQDIGEYSLFRFRLDSAAWSEFSGEPDIRFSMLDDGEHMFEIESTNKGHDDTSSETFTFIVSVLDSTAVYIVPQKTVLGMSDTAVVRVEVKNLAACDRMHLAFSGAEIDSIYLPEESDGDSLLLFADDTIADVLAIPGVMPFKETATVVMLRVIGKGEDTTRIIFECTARDTNNVDLEIKQIRGCLLLRNGPIKWTHQ